MIRLPTRLARLLARSGFVLAAISVAALCQAQSSVASDLPSAAQKKVTSSIDKALDATSVSEERTPSELGWDCVAAASLAERGDARGKARVRILADALMRDVVKTADGKALGWTADIKDKRCPQGGYDAFGDGSCNPPSTVYAFQTGLAVACLASASKLLDDPALLATAKQAFEAWRPFLIPATPCPDCAYFAMSSSPNDAGRYVRNMNVFMALGGASLAAVGDADAGRLAKRLMASELAESARGNKGYLGFMDPGWKKNPALEGDRIENHAAAVAVVSERIGELLASADYRQHGLRVWREWATCDNDRCRAAACRYWAGDPARCQATLTAAHCAFRSADPLARERCVQYLEKTREVGSFGLLSIAIDAPVEAPKQPKR